MVHFAIDIPLEKSKFSFTSSYQWEIVSGLGMGHVPTSPILRIPSGANPCRPGACCNSLWCGTNAYILGFNYSRYWAEQKPSKKWYQHVDACIHIKLDRAWEVILDRKE